MSRGLGMIRQLAMQSPARGFAIGVAIAGAVAIAIGQSLTSVPTSAFYDPSYGDGDDVYLILLAYPSVLLGGLIGGWLSWQKLMPRPPATLTRTVVVAGASTVSSLAVGVLFGTLGLALIWSATRLADGFLSDPLSTLGLLLALTLATGFWFAPVYAVTFFGIPFVFLVAVWTLLWRAVINRAGQPMAPAELQQDS